MTAERYSILFVGEASGDSASLVDSFSALSVHCSVLPPEAAHDFLRTTDIPRHDVVLIDEASSNGRLPSILTSLKRWNGNAPAVIVLAADAARGAAFIGADEPLCLPKDRCDAATIVRAARSLTERRCLSEALAQSEARYRQLLQSVTDYTYTIRVENGQPVSSRHSPGCSAVTGYSPEEYEADRHLWYRMIHEADREAVISMSDLVCAGMSPPPLEHRIIHKNGSVRWIKNTPVPRHDAAGRLSAWDGLVTDITDRKLAEEKLQQEFLHLERAKQEWEVTFDSISDPIFIHDRECRIIRANRAYREAAGRPFSEIIGRRFFNVFPRLDASVMNVRLDQDNPADNQPYYVEEFAVSDLRRVFRGRVYPTTDKDGKILSCVQVLEDVTEMKRAEESMRQEMEISTNLLSLAEASTGTMDLDRLMERIVSCCARILGADAFLSYAWDEAGRALRPGRHTALPPGTVPLFRTEPTEAAGDIGRIAIETRRACIVRAENGINGGTDRFVLEQPGAASPIQLIDSPLPWFRDAKTFLAIPLFGKTDCLGLLVGVYRTERAISGRDLKIIEGVSREASLALDEARLYRTALERSMELAHKMETLKVIHELDRSILSSLEPREILETAVRNIARIIPCDSAEAMLISQERESLDRIAGSFSGGTVSGPARLSRESTAAADILATSRPAYTPDLVNDTPLLPEESRLLAGGVRSLFRVPLMTKGSAVGVLTVASKRPAAFTPEDFETLEQLAAQIGVAFENTRLLTDLQELFLGTVKSLSYAIDAKSSWTAGHSERVTQYALQLGRALGMAEGPLRDLELAGLLHDVGKLGVFDAILDKKTVLSKEEFEMIKRHPRHGAELLAPIKQMQQIIPAVRHHHERFDGKGYPDGLKGDQIPGLARILAVADAFDSMTGWRPYRKTFDKSEAVEELRRCSGTQFDPVFAGCFIDVLRKGEVRLNA